MGEWRQGLKFDLGATMQRAVLFSLTQEDYPAPPPSSRKKSMSQHFFAILLHSRGQMSTLWANGQGLQNRTRDGKQRTVLFNLT